MRTLKPCLACPWFGLALKTALDAKQRQGAQYEELLSQCTGGLASDSATCYFTLVVHALNMVTSVMHVYSAGDGDGVRACAQVKDGGQGQVQDGTSAVCIRTAGDRSTRDAIKALQESVHQGSDRHHCQRPGKGWAWHCTSEEGQEDQLDQRLLHCAAKLAGR